MNNISKSTGDKPRGKGKVRVRKTKQSNCKSKNWDFKPRLKNEAIVLYSILSVYDIPYYEEIVNDIRNLVTSLIRNHGFTDGPKRYNVLKQYTVELIEFRNPTNPGWLSTSEKYNVPSKLGINFIQLIVDYLKCTDTALRNKYYQAIITILNIPRIVDGLTEADFKSVTDKATAIEEDLLSEFANYLAKTLNTYHYDIQKPNFSKYKVNFKKRGPSGKPKLESATDEAVCLLEDKELSKPFKILLSELGGSHLYTYVSALANQAMATHGASSEYPPTSTNLRKLVTVPDSGMKTRIVAIVDFWSQLALEPVRDHVQLVTRKLFNRTDFRLNQDGGVKAMVQFQKRCMSKEIIGDHELDIQSLKFYDISSWTDRFHRDLQKLVVAELFGSRLAQAWAQLTVHCSWQVGNTGRTLKYGQGQGMGTNGSFDIATLTDHLYINFLYSEKYENKDIINFIPYGKVGDDLWIYDPENLIPIYYEKINLPINMSKSKTFCELGSVAEFCSRTFVNGVDCSRISPKLISRSTNFRYLPLLLSYCASRGIQMYRSSFKYLDNNVKDTDELYFDKLQPWIISTFVASSDNFSHLTLDYLEAGNWITDHTKSVISDQATLLRIQTARALVHMVRFYDDIEMKTSETIEAEGSLSMEDMFVLATSQDDTFDLTNTKGALALKWFETDNILSPKQVFVLNRYITQNHLVTDKFMELYSLDPSSDTYVLDAKDLLEEISQRSVYDRGNINYDQHAYISMQYDIVETLSRLDEDFNTLPISRSEEDKLSRITGSSVLQSELTSILNITILKP